MKNILAILYLVSFFYFLVIKQNFQQKKIYSQIEFTVELAYMIFQLDHECYCSIFKVFNLSCCNWIVFVIISL